METEKIEKTASFGQMCNRVLKGETEGFFIRFMCGNEARFGLVYRDSGENDDPGPLNVEHYREYYNTKTKQSRGKTGEATYLQSIIHYGECKICNNCKNYTGKYEKPYPVAAVIPRPSKQSNTFAKREICNQWNILDRMLLDNQVTEEVGNKKGCPLFEWKIFIDVAIMKLSMTAILEGGLPGFELYITDALDIPNDIGEDVTYKYDFNYKIVSTEHKEKPYPEDYITFRVSARRKER